MTTVILTTLPNTIDAHMLKNLLEREGIESFLVNEYFTDWAPYYYNILGSGVQIVVRNKDLTKARKIAGLGNSQVTCPSCGSSNVQLKHEKPKRKFTLLFIVIFLTSLIGNLLNDYVCEDCNSEFRAY